MATGICAEKLDLSDDEAGPGESADQNRCRWVKAMARVGPGFDGASAGAVGLAGGLAILSAPMIARLIHHVAAPRREVTPNPSREPSHGQAAAAQAPRG
jgi:hypothetical protein